MKNSTACAVAALAFLAGCSTPRPVVLPGRAPYLSVDDSGWQSILRVGNAHDPFVGTCWAIGDGLFATAAHVPADESALMILGCPAELVYFDGPNDFAILRCPGAKVPPLVLNTGPVVGIRARARGYTNGGGRQVQTTGTISCVAWSDGFVGYDGGIQPGMSGARVLWDEFSAGRIQRYGALRDFPALKGVSYLSVHQRFGTISIRELVRGARQSAADVWLSELIWRDFYFMILDRFPRVVGHSFKPEYDAIQWADRPEAFAAWCAGRTGYPLVDAAMRQLNHSGWMHNRLRMVVASFLTKDLGIDWRLGERYFAEQLNDFDLSANNGGWQWASSSGCDAQPYFRIFNPITQSERFDLEGKFIRRYVPELAKVANKYIHAPWLMGRVEQEGIGVVIGKDYPGPIVDHAQAREETLARYAVVKK